MRVERDVDFSAVIGIGRGTTSHFNCHYFRAEKRTPSDLAMCPAQRHSIIIEIGAVLRRMPLTPASIHGCPPDPRAFDRRATSSGICRRLSVSLERCSTASDL